MAQPINYDKLPLKYVMENDILSDVVYSNQSIKDSLEKFKNKLLVDDSRDFFMIVISDKLNIFMGILTFLELKNMLDDEKKNLIDKKFIDIMNTKNPHLTDKNTIQDVLNLFESHKKLNIIPILNKDKKYVGKVKRSNIDEMIKQLIKSLSN